MGRFSTGKGKGEPKHLRFSKSHELRIKTCVRKTRLTFTEFITNAALYYCEVVEGIAVKHEAIFTSSDIQYINSCVRKKQKENAAYALNNLIRDGTLLQCEVIEGRRIIDKPILEALREMFKEEK